MLAALIYVEEDRTSRGMAWRGPRGAVGQARRENERNRRDAERKGESEAT